MDVRMKEEYISVIVPVYNCEKYLSRCLDSVIGQKYGKIEIILINDGSSDRTAEICKEYAGKDARIVYIEQSNHGVAYTRKKAIDLASGQYIGFVDADDFIDETMYAQMISHMKSAQLVTSGYFYQKKQIFDALPEGLYEGDAGKAYLYENMILVGNTGKIGITTNLWSKLFLASKLKKAAAESVQDLFMGEDADLLFRYILMCDAVSISGICSYHHELNEASIMNTVNHDYLRNVDCLYRSLAEEFEKSAYREKLLPKWNRWIWMMLQNAPQFMGWQFESHTERIRYISPYMNLLPKKRVVLYGAGAVGKDFYRLHQKSGDMEIVLWVDRNWEDLQKAGLTVSSTERIQDVDFDYILLAVKEKEMADAIGGQLRRQGISDSQILWKKPVQMDDEGMD